MGAVASTPGAFSAVLCPTPGAGVWSLALGLKRSALDANSTFCARWTRRSAKYCESAVRATLGLIIRLGLGTDTLEGICGGFAAEAGGVAPSGSAAAWATSEGIRGGFGRSRISIQPVMLVLRSGPLLLSSAGLDSPDSNALLKPSLPFPPTAPADPCGGPRTRVAGRRTPRERPRPHAGSATGLPPVIASRADGTLRHLHAGLDWCRRSATPSPFANTRRKSLSPHPPWRRLRELFRLPAPGR